MSISSVPLGEVMASKRASLDPRKTPDQEFELFSIPAFDAGTPEIVAGSAIGSSKQVVVPGDVLLSRIVPHIRRAWVVRPLSDRPTIGSGEWIIFRSDRFDSDYLRHVLVSDRFHQAFMQTVAGVGGSLLRARPSNVAKIEIPLPPIEEQRRIAAVLDAADVLRAKRRHALAKLDTLIQAIFVDMFGELAATASLDACGDVVTGTTPATKEPGLWGGDIPFITPGDIDPNSGAVTTERSLSAEGGTRCRLLPPRSVVVTCIGNIGRVGLTTTTSATNQQINAVIPSELIEPTYLVQALRNPRVIKQMEAAASSTTLPILNKTNFSKIMVPIPPVHEQRKFHDMVTDYHVQRSRYRASADQLDIAFSSLQQRAFRGEL